MSSIYDVEVTRDDRWWMIRVPAIDALTQARRLSEVELMARELIAVSTDARLEDVEVNVRLDDLAGVSAGQELAAIEADRRQIETLKHDLAERVSGLAHDLVAAGVPLRDIGELLDVSHQRVHQIVGVGSKHVTQAPDPRDGKLMTKSDVRMSTKGVSVPAKTDRKASQATSAPTPKRSN